MTPSMPTSRKQPLCFLDQFPNQNSGQRSAHDYSALGWFIRVQRAGLNPSGNLHDITNNVKFAAIKQWRGDQFWFGKGRRLDQLSHGASKIAQPANDHPNASGAA